MDKLKIGLHIKREEQSRDDIAQMITSGDRFIARITHNGEDTEKIFEMEVVAIESPDPGPHKPAFWHVYIGSKRFVLKFNSLLYCDELPPEMISVAT